MNREEKTTAVAEIASQIEESEAVFAVDYRGISVPQAAELRTKLRDSDASFRVVKNRLTKLAADQAGREELKELLEGPTALTFVRGDTATAAKTITAFNREHDVLVFKGGFMEDLALDSERFTAISRLPGRDVLIGQFAGVVASPITGLVRGLGSLISGLALQLGQIAEQGLVSGEPPAAAAEEAPAPAEEVPAEEAPAEGESADDGPAEDAPAEDAPAKDAPAEAAEEPAPPEEQPDANAAETTDSPADAPAEEPPTESAPEAEQSSEDPSQAEGDASEDPAPGSEAGDVPGDESTQAEQTEEE